MCFFNIDTTLLPVYRKQEGKGFHYHYQVHSCATVRTTVPIMTDKKRNEVQEPLFHIVIIVMSIVVEDGMIYIVRHNA